MRKFFLLPLAAVLLLVVIPNVHAGWWDSNWTKRRPITISGSHPENYQIKIIVPYDADMRPDYGDLRFLENEGSGLLNYWIENYTADNAVVWVRRQENTDNTIYLYYGNPNATSQSNRWLVMDFFDDFDDGVFNTVTPTNPNGNRMFILLNNGTVNERNGRLELTGGPYSSNRPYVGIENTFFFGPTYAMVEFDVLFPGVIYDWSPCPLVWWDKVVVGTYSEPRNSIVLFLSTNATNENVRLGKFEGGSWTLVARSSQFMSANTWHHVQFALWGTPASFSAKTWVNGNKFFDNTGLSFSPTVQGSATGVTCREGSSSWAYYDNFQIRKYIEPEPTVTVGGEESVPAEVEILFVSPDNLLVDRSAQWSANAVQATRITIRVQDANGIADIRSVNITIWDGAGIVQVDNARVTENQVVDENENIVDFYFVYNPVDSIPDNALGCFLVRARVYTLSSGNTYQDNTLWVDDIVSVIWTQENLPGHSHRITAQHRRNLSAVRVYEGYDKRQLAPSVSDNTITLEYAPRYGGGYFLDLFLLDNGCIDGVVRLDYFYPDLKPSSVWFGIVGSRAVDRDIDSPYTTPKNILFRLSGYDPDNDAWYCSLRLKPRTDNWQIENNFYALDRDSYWDYYFDAPDTAKCENVKATINCYDWHKSGVYPHQLTSYTNIGGENEHFLYDDNLDTWGFVGAIWDLGSVRPRRLEFKAYLFGAGIWVSVDGSNWITVAHRYLEEEPLLVYDNYFDNFRYVKIYNYSIYSRYYYLNVYDATTLSDNCLIGDLEMVLTPPSLIYCRWEENWRIDVFLRGFSEWGYNENLATFSEPLYWRWSWNGLTWSETRTAPLYAYFVESNLPGTTVPVRLLVAMPDAHVDGRLDTHYTVNENELWEITLRWENGQPVNATNGMTAKFLANRGSPETHVFGFTRNPENFVVPTQKQVFRITVENGDRWRSRVPNDYGGRVTIYLAPWNQLQAYIISIEDYTGLFANGWVRLYTSVPCFEEWWGPSRNAVVHLLPGTYAVRLFSADGSRVWELQPWTASSDPSPPAWIVIYERAENYTYWWDLHTATAFRRGDGAVVVHWSGPPCDMTIRVMELNLIRYQTSFSGENEVTCVWTGADNDASYTVELQTSDPALGTHVQRFTVGPLPRRLYGSSPSSGLGLPVSLVSLGTLFVFLCVIGVWTPENASWSLLAGGGMLLFLKYGLEAAGLSFPLPSAVIVLVLCVGAIWKIAEAL